MAEKPGNPISRREFARRAAIASAVASIGPAGAVGAGIASAATPASESATQVPAPSGPVQAQLPANMPRLSPESQAEADARFQAILAQYGGRLSEEQKTDLHRLCVLAQPPLDRLRAYPVQNGDGAALYLKPLFEREKKPKPPSTSQPGTAKPAAAAPGAASGAAKKP